MIDDAVLDGLVRGAGDAVPVPADGPARILAARDALGSPATSARPRGTPSWRPPHARRQTVVSLVAVAALVALVVLVAGGLHGSGSRSTAAKASSGAAAVAPAIGSVPAVASGSAAGTGSGAAAPAIAPKSALAPLQSSLAPFAPFAPLVPAPIPTTPSQVPALPSKVIKTGQVTLQVARGQVPTVIGTLSSDAAALGGFVAASASTDSVPGAAATGDLTLRVPVAAFDTLVGDARHAGKATTVTTAGQDVTSQYVDLQARIASLSAARTQYQQILAKATTIGDILSVESQLTDVQTQIEQLQGQIQVLGDQSSYSTLTVHLAEAGTTPPPPPHPVVRSGLSKAWAHARATFASGFESLVGATGGIAVFLIAVAVLGVAGRLAWLVTRRRLL